MKNTKSLIELIVIAIPTFQDEKNKGVNEVYATEDGFTFIEENRARVHCKSIPDLKFHTITRTQALQALEYQETADPVHSTVMNAVIDTSNLDQNPDTDKEMTELKTQYEELFGKQAHHNIGVEKLKTLIAEKLAETGDNNQEGQENADDDVQSQPNE